MPKEGNKKAIDKVAFIGKAGLDKHKALIEEAYNYVLKKKKEVYFDKNIGELLNQPGEEREDLLKKVDLAIVLGGDGTLLQTAQALSNRVVYCYGINFGNVGFLTESTKERMLAGLKRIMSKKFVVDKRSLLRVTVYRNGHKMRTHLALNDAVINQGVKARLIKLRLEMNQRKVSTFEADGLIIATPTGSTGHSLSAGGPIVHPKMDALIVTPICPVSLAQRPIVMPNDRQLKVFVETERDYLEQIAMTIDGQQSFGLEYDDEVKFRKSRRHLYLIRMTGENYYRALRAKLGWGD